MSDDLQGGTRSYRPGTWFGIFGAGASVLLPPSEKARVAALWELVDDGAGFDEVLDALISGGLRELPGFVLVSERDGETKVVLRGAARATFLADGETVELEGSRATTWVERSLHGVTRMTVQVADETDGPDHSIAGGLVRLARLDEPPYSPDPGGRVDGEASPVGDNVADEADVEPADDGAGAEDAPEDEVSSVVEPTSLEEPAGEAGAEGEGEPSPTTRSRNGTSPESGTTPPGTSSPPKPSTSRPSGRRPPRPRPRPPTTETATATATGPPRPWRPSPSPPARPSTSTARSWSAARPSRAATRPPASPAWWPCPARTRRSPRPTSRCAPGPAPTTAPRWSRTSARPTAPSSSSRGCPRRTSRPA